jgi:hypothetical protein
MCKLEAALVHSLIRNVECWPTETPLSRSLVALTIASAVLDLLAA